MVPRRTQVFKSAGKNKDNIDAPNSFNALDMPIQKKVRTMDPYSNTKKAFGHVVINKDTE